MQPTSRTRYACAGLTATAINSSNSCGNRDLSDHDPDGPLPRVDPVVGENTIARGRASVRMYRDPICHGQIEWRARDEAGNLHTRE